MDPELPGAARVWLTTVALPGTRLLSAVWLPGGIDRSNHLVTLAGPDGEREYVLRRWTRANWRETDPDVDVAREATALALLEAAGARTPRVLATDPDGTGADVPAMVITRLPGGLPPARLSDVDGYLAQLADAEAEVHLPDPVGLPPYRPYHDLVDRVVPADTTDPGRWRAAFEYLAGRPEPAGSVLIHRDYHPANLLWTGERATGVIDWANASVGHPDMDTAHMRYNLTVSYGLDVATAYGRMIAARRGGYDRYWDVRAIVDIIEGLRPGEALTPNLPWLGADRSGRLEELERLLADALA